MKYVEITALKKAVTLREIPKDLIQGMKLLNPNSGSTSLVFEKSDDEVRVFTRDKHKFDYTTLQWGLHLGKTVDIIEKVRYNRDIFVYDVPKLYPVTGDNKKIALLIAKTIKQSIMQEINKNNRLIPSVIVTNASAILENSGINNKIYEIAIEELERLFDYLANYTSDDESIDLDIAVRNFKQTKDGTLVMYDPIVDGELINAMRGW